jgi:ATP-dependent exoDNAse (exonuclease V) beta subunit
MDRVVLALKDGAPVAAEIIDFKTDRIGAGGSGGAGGAGDAVAALDAAVERYRPQMQAYRRALCALTGLAPPVVACRLLFLEVDALRDA